MITFDFTVCKSFLADAGHPITIPKGQISYNEMLALGLDHRAVTVVLPSGKKFDGHIYHGDAGYGEYYQIQVDRRSGALPSDLEVGDSLIVAMFKHDKQSYVVIEER